MLFEGATPQETAFAKACAAKFLQQGNWGGNGFIVDLSDEGSPPAAAPAPARKQKAPQPAHDLSKLLKTTRRSGFF